MESIVLSTSAWTGNHFSDCRADADAPLTILGVTAINLNFLTV
jgi:hypothetical protein